MKIEPCKLEWKDAYKLLIGSVLPRPIAFVSTMDKCGHKNLAPFSFFTGICADPFMVCFAPMLRGTDGKKKDTLLNIEETKEFVINIVSEDFVEKMNNCAIEYDRHVDEFSESGLTTLDSQIVKPPRVKESKVQLECVLHDILYFGDQPGAGSLVIGQVVFIHIDDALYFDGKIDTDLLKPIGRMAGATYTRAASDTFVLERKRTKVNE